MQTAEGRGYLNGAEGGWWARRSADAGVGPLDREGLGRPRCGFGRSDPWEARLDESGARKLWSPEIFAHRFPACQFRGVGA